MIKQSDLHDDEDSSDSEEDSDMEEEPVHLGFDNDSEGTSIETKTYVKPNFRTAETL